MEEKKAKKFLRQVSGWSLTANSKKIRKQFKFKNFIEAMAFVNKAAAIMELERHHSDILISYNKVTLTNYTHKIQGLHDNDFILAAKIDKLKS